MPHSNFSKLSYMIRCIRVWNVVADDELNLSMNARNDFNQAMVEQYKTALSNHDCLKCNKCRSLAQPVSCCC